MDVLITGVSGYIGSHAAEVFLNNGYRVYGLDLVPNEIVATLNGDYLFFQGDIRDYKFVHGLFLKLKLHGDFIVLHLAGLKNARESYEKSTEYFEVNLGGTEVILRVMRELNLNHLIFASSCSVYGEGLESERVKEDSTCKPISPYGKTKMYAEIAIQNATIGTPLKAVSLRFFNVIGNSVFLESDKSKFGLLPSLYKSTYNGSIFKIFGKNFKTIDGTCMRDFVDVRVIAELLLKLASKMFYEHQIKSVYNIGSGNGYTVYQISKMVDELIDGKLEISLEDSVSGDPASIVADSTLASKDLEWNHNIAIEDSILSGWKSWLRTFGIREE